MSRTFVEIIDDYMKLHGELQKKVFNDVICPERVIVVRCKDCKYWHSNTEFCDIWSYPNVARKTLPRGYCSRGERREDGEA